MKKIVYSALTIGVILFACSKEDDTATTSTSSTSTTSASTTSTATTGTSTTSSTSTGTSTTSSDTTDTSTTSSTSSETTTGSTSSSSDNAPTFSKDIQAILTTNCTYNGVGGCHSSGSTNGDFTSYTGFSTDVSNGKVNNRVLASKNMPPSYASGAKSLSSEDLLSIQAWIGAGAKND